MMLPTEVLDIVFSKIHLKTAAPTSEPQATFSSLCLTSKHFLPLAREYLYYRPFRDDIKITWAHAQDLCKILTENDGRLGQLVRSLEGIVGFVGKLDKAANFGLRFSVPLIADQYSQAILWYLVVIKACPRLVEVELFKVRPHMFDLVQTALEGTTSTLRTIGFSGVFQELVYGLPTPPSATISETLSKPWFRNITTVKLLDFGDLPYEWLQQVSLSDAPKFTESQHSPHFLTLHISGGTSPSSGLNNLILSLAPRIRHCSFVANIHEPGCGSSEWRYARLYRFDFDLAIFTPATNLTSIRMNNFRACFLDLLANLLSSAPQLELIDFHGSHWTQRDDDTVRGGGERTTFESRYGPACSKKEVESSLAPFCSLRRVDLGVLPTASPQDYEGLGSDLKVKGIEIEWDYCRAAAMVIHEGC